jgi:FG-GAP-like repeat
MLLLALLAIDFTSNVIATDLPRGYQVIAVDMNKDGLADLVALASGMPELYWFENPTWKRHTIAGPFKEPINLAVRDIDGDGIPEIGLAYEFANQAKNSVGVVALLRSKDGSDGSWQPTQIDRLTTSHRLRWATIAPGRTVLVNATLTGAAAAPPMYEDQAPLVFYEAPAFKRQTISDASRGVMHGVLVFDWDGDRRDDILTSSMSGIHVHRLKNGTWERTEITKGDPSAWPKSGSSDIAVGKLGRRRLVASIEPWHGHQVAVYSGGKRAIIDDALTDGHTILTADFDKDGRDEIVAGFRGGKRGVYLYRERNGSWAKQIVEEGGMAAAACAAHDFDGDGWIDLACIGSATQNLKWYRNNGGGKPN